MKPTKIKILKWLAFIIATALALSTMFLLPRFQRKIPDIPDDNLHTKVSKLEECLQCHGETGGNTLPQGHKARQQCLYCHKYRN